MEDILVGVASGRHVGALRLVTKLRALGKYLLNFLRLLVTIPPPYMASGLEVAPWGWVRSIL